MATLPRSSCSLTRSTRWLDWTSAAGKRVWSILCLPWPGCPGACVWRSYGATPMGWKAMSYSRRRWGGGVGRAPDLAMALVVSVGLTGGLTQGSWTGLGSALLVGSLESLPLGGL